MAIEQDNSDAYYAMAKAYYNGFGVEKDIPKSTELWTKSAELGHWGAQYITGLNYEDGDGVNKDFNKAVKWYTLAADQNHLDACYKLAEIYRLGKNDIERNDEKAVHYYKITYNGGQEDATFRLGVLYYNGECGLNESKEKAFKIWKKGIDAGYGGCSKNVGLCYKDGTGIAQNFEMAIKYFEKAMEQGNFDAILQLGYAYALLLFCCNSIYFVPTLAMVIACMMSEKARAEITSLSGEQWAGQVTRFISPRANSSLHGSHRFLLDVSKYKIAMT